MGLTAADKDGLIADCLRAVAYAIDGHHNNWDIVTALRQEADRHDRRDKGGKP